MDFEAQGLRAVMVEGERLGVMDARVGTIGREEGQTDGVLAKREDSRERVRRRKAGMIICRIILSFKVDGRERQAEG